MEQDEALNRSLEILKECGRVLGKSHATCCISERAVLFKAALDKLREVLFELQFGQKTAETLKGCITSIAECGSIVGELYATCCTPLRTPTYGSILDKLNQAGSDLGGVIYAMQQVIQPQAQ